MNLQDAVEAAGKRIDAAANDGGFVPDSACGRLVSDFGIECDEFNDAILTGVDALLRLIGNSDELERASAAGLTEEEFVAFSIGSMLGQALLAGMLLGRSAAREAAATS